MGRSLSRRWMSSVSPAVWYSARSSWWLAASHPPFGEFGGLAIGIEADEPEVAVAERRVVVDGLALNEGEVAVGGQEVPGEVGVAGLVLDPDPAVDDRLAAAPRGGVRLGVVQGLLGEQAADVVGVVGFPGGPVAVHPLADLLLARHRSSSSRCRLRFVGCNGAAMIPHRGGARGEHAIGARGGRRAGDLGPASHGMLWRLMDGRHDPVVASAPRLAVSEKGWRGCPYCRTWSRGSVRARSRSST